MNRLSSVAFAVICLAATGHALAACPADGSANGVQVQSGYVGDSLTDNRSSWGSGYVQAVARNGARQALYVRAESDSRFGATDAQYEAVFYAPISPHVYGSAGASFSPTHQFLAASGDQAGLDVRSGGGYGYQLQYEERNYALQQVALTSAGADRYAGHDHFGVMLTLENVNAAGGSALSERAYYSHSLACDSMTFSVSNGRDAELTGVGSNLAVYHQTSYDVDELHWMSRNLAIDAGAGWYVLLGAYNRFEVRVALRQRL